MFGWPAWLSSGFSGNLALEICFILSFVSLYVILFEPNKYLLFLLLLLLLDTWAYPRNWQQLSALCPGTHR